MLHRTNRRLEVMDLTTRLLLQNRAWSEEMIGRHPTFFRQLATGQQPGAFWIGCADSRVPAECITNASPGELFVHRSIANLVSPCDPNVMSALQYAVDVLKVSHVIVCGHQACGGVRAALLSAGDSEDAPSTEGDYLGRHIAPLRALYRRRRHEVDGGPAEAGNEAAIAARVNRLVTVNVSEQVQTLAATKTVREAWARGQPLQLHGWVYGLRDGRLWEVLTLSPEQPALAA